MAGIDFTAASSAASGKLANALRAARTRADFLAATPNFADRAFKLASTLYSLAGRLQLSLTFFSFLTLTTAAGFAAFATGLVVSRLAGVRAAVGVFAAGFEAAVGAGLAERGVLVVAVAMSRCIGVKKAKISLIRSIIAA